MDGQYGDGTVQAVTLFQAQHGLERRRAGWRGDAGACVLRQPRRPSCRPPRPPPRRSVIRKGEHSDRVMAVQERLKQLGYYSGEIDGQFGSGTEEAVRLFQRQNGLDVDGIIGNHDPDRRDG